MLRLAVILSALIVPSSAWALDYVGGGVADLNTKIMSLATGQTKPFEFYVRTTPTTASQNITPALTGRLRHDGTAGIVYPNGHVIGVLAQVENNVAQRIDRAFGLEARIDNLNAGGIFTFASSVEATLSINNGTVDTWAAFHITNHSGVAGITTRYSFLSEDPGAILANSGPGQFVGSVSSLNVAASIQPGLELSYGNAINAGSKLYWTVEQSTETGNMSHQLISGSRADTTFQVYNGALITRLKIRGDGPIEFTGTLVANGATGLSVTKTVRAAGGAADCTLIFTSGLLTGGTC